MTNLVTLLRDDCDNLSCAECTEQRARAADEIERLDLELRQAGHERDVLVEELAGMCAVLRLVRDTQGGRFGHSWGYVERAVNEALARPPVEPNELLAAARVALDEMCKTSAPRNSFTDAVDRLDAAISNAARTWRLA